VQRYLNVAFCHRWRCNLETCQLVHVFDIKRNRIISIADMIEEEHLRWNENGVINRMTSLVIKNNGVLVVPAPVPLIVKRRCNQRSFRLWALLPWLDGVSVRSSIRGGCCRLWWCWCRWSFTETTNVTLLCCSSVRFYVNKTRFQFCNPSKGLWRHSINATNVSIISQQYGEPVHVCRGTLDIMKQIL